jgi:DNA-binding IclR family transcriptional regulator
MTGRKPEITDKEILQVFVESTDPVLSAPEIADQFGYSTPGIYKRLRTLQENGFLESKKIS